MNFLEIWIGVVLAVTWKMLAVNGETTFSVTTVYEDNTCTGVPSLLTFAPDAGCQVLTDNQNQFQATGNSLFAVSSCTTDYEGFVATAFGDTSPYMIHRYYSVQQRWVRVCVLGGRLLPHVPGLFQRLWQLQSSDRCQRSNRIHVIS